MFGELPQTLGGSGLPHMLGMGALNRSPSFSPIPKNGEVPYFGKFPDSPNCSIEQTTYHFLPAAKVQRGLGRDAFWFVYGRNFLCTGRAHCAAEEKSNLQHEEGCFVCLSQVKLSRWGPLWQVFILLFLESEKDDYLLQWKALPWKTQTQIIQNEQRSDAIITMDGVQFYIGTSIAGLDLS